jgi:hypothetical protein
MTRALALLLLPLIISISASATDLSGQVIEVIDGNTISLKSLSHTIGPPWLWRLGTKPAIRADVARQHLTDLILRKFVVVRYTGIGDRGYLVGRILLEQADVNADAEGWWPGITSRRRPTCLKLTVSCTRPQESGARRTSGIVAGSAPVAWDFRKSLLRHRPPAAAAAPPRAQTDCRRAPKRSSLASEDMRCANARQLPASRNLEVSRQRSHSGAISTLKTNIFLAGARRCYGGYLSGPRR